MRRISPFLLAGAAAAALGMVGVGNSMSNAYAPPPAQFQLREEDRYPGERGRQKRKRQAREASGRNYRENRRHREGLRAVNAEWNQAMQCLTNRMKMRWNDAGMPGLREKDPAKVWAFHPASAHIQWSKHYNDLRRARLAGER